MDEHLGPGQPVIAQVHGWCLAGGSELATGCDLVYVSDDARIGYPAVRFGVPDMQFHAWFLGPQAAMEMMLTGDWISGEDAVRLGWANRVFPADRLDDEVLAMAERIALVPPDIAQLNKRTVHRAMDVMGLRTAIRSGTELCWACTSPRSGPSSAMPASTGPSAVRAHRWREPDRGVAAARRAVRRLPHRHRSWGEALSTGSPGGRRAPWASNPRASGLTVRCSAT